MALNKNIMYVLAALGGKGLKKRDGQIDAVKPFPTVYKRIYFIEYISELYIESTVLDKRKQTILQWTLYRVH